MASRQISGSFSSEIIDATKDQLSSFIKEDENLICITELEETLT
jgi:hypothetical protein